MTRHWCRIESMRIWRTSMRSLRIAPVSLSWMPMHMRWLHMSHEARRAHRMMPHLTPLFLTRAFGLFSMQKVAHVRRVFWTMCQMLGQLMAFSTMAVARRAAGRAARRATMLMAMPFMLMPLATRRSTHTKNSVDRRQLL